jgi:hypothetical protein
MPQSVHILHASIDQLEQWINVVEKTNFKLTQQAQKLQYVVIVASLVVEYEHELWVQDKSSIVIVLDKLIQVWTSF